MHSPVHSPQTVDYVKPGLPVEIISLILSMTEACTLANIACVSRAMQLEAERYLYYESCLKGQIGCQTFFRATKTNMRRRMLVHRLVYAEIETINPYFHVLLGRFPNLSYIDFGVDPWDYLPKYPMHLPFKLQSLRCDIESDPDSNMHKLVNWILWGGSATQNIRELDMCASFTSGYSLAPDVLPNLETLTATTSTMCALVPGRPVTRVSMLGSITASQFSWTLLPIFLLSTQPLAYLDVNIDRCTTHTFRLVAHHFPQLTHFRLRDCTKYRQDSTPPDPDTLPEDEWKQDMAGWAQQLGKLQHLVHFRYEGELERPWMYAFPDNVNAWAPSSLQTVSFDHPWEFFIRKRKNLGWIRGGAAMVLIRGLKPWLGETPYEFLAQLELPARYPFGDEYDMTYAIAPILLPLVGIIDSVA